MLPHILPSEEEEITEVVHKSYKQNGIEIAVNARVTGVEKKKDGIVVIGDTGEERSSWEGELCLVSVGVQANSDGIGLKEIGVETKKGFVTVDDAYRTTVPHIRAIGDLIGAPMLAHAASHEGIAAVEGIAGLPVKRVSPQSVPSCTYCHPQVASLGMTEKQVMAAGVRYRIGKFPFVASSKAVAVGEREGLVKLIFERETNRLLGAHIVGPDATELIAELGTARLFPDALRAITTTIHAHPTLAEAVAEAALDADDRAIHL
jgi:dihydrolipoamide dehydrogenase